MAYFQTLILNSGGMRSLVATAMSVDAGDPNRMALLHVKDGRACVSIRQDHANRQATRYGIKQVFEVDIEHLHGRKRLPAMAGDEPAPKPAGREPVHSSLIRPQVLLVGLAYAVDLGVDRLIWPCQFNADYDAITRVSEQLILMQQLAELEHPKLPEVQTPLLELTDQQMVELGGHHAVPWELAWSCQLCGQTPCRQCATCKRRQVAFDAAGIVDPLAAGVPRPA